MNDVVQTMMNCIKYEIRGQKERENVVLPEVSVRFLTELYKLSKAHDVAHLVGDALNKCGAFNNLPDTIEENERATIIKIKAKFDEQVFTAVYRYENINYELEQIKQTFNEAKIPFIPLKGSVIRKYYPEPWMRTSCDIDILVKEEDLEKAVKSLTEKKGFKQDGKRNFHDISLYSPAGIHLELHFNIKETVEKLDAVLQTAWEHATKNENSENEYEYKFSEDFFLFHLYAHASYHFIGGGCGVRPFIDFYLLKRNLTFDNEKAEALLDSAGIKFFAKKVEELSEVWFGERAHDEITKEAEEFVLSGGVYGNAVNHAAVKQAEKGKSAHLRSRIWLPYKNLIVLYPSLKGKRILQPLYEIRRWFKLFKKSTFQRSVRELKTNASMKQEEVSKAQKLLNDLELL